MLCVMPLQNTDGRGAIILKWYLRSVDSTAGPGSSLAPGTVTCVAVTLEICRPKTSLSRPRRICCVNLITLTPDSSAHLLMRFRHPVALFCVITKMCNTRYRKGRGVPRTVQWLGYRAGPEKSRFDLWQKQYAFLNSTQARSGPHTAS